MVEHFRNGVKIGQYEFPNGITNQGKNKLLDVMFHGVSAAHDLVAGDDRQRGLYRAGRHGHLRRTSAKRATSGPSSPATPTPATAKAPAPVPAWTVGAASSQASTNASPVVFDITGSGTVKGLFLVGGIANAQNKSNHDASGILWATALFGTGDVPVNASDQLKVTYTVSA